MNHKDNDAQSTLALIQWVVTRRPISPDPELQTDGMDVIECDEDDEEYPTAPA
jgi:hypothetical protein